MKETFYDDGHNFIISKFSIIKFDSENEKILNILIQKNPNLFVSKSPKSQSKKYIFLATNYSKVRFLEICTTLWIPKPASNDANVTQNQTMHFKTEHPYSSAHPLCFSLLSLVSQIFNKTHQSLHNHLIHQQTS